MVLPAEYGVDPTGVGRLTGLSEMGEIKVQLAKEAAADRALDQNQGRAPASAGPDKRSSLFGSIVAELLVRPAAAQAASVARSQEMTVALSPIDLIPDFVPLLGYVDDLVIVPIGILLAVKLVPAVLMAEFRAEAVRRAKPISRGGLVLIVVMWAIAAAVLLWLFWPGGTA